MNVHELRYIGDGPLSISFADSRPRAIGTSRDKLVKPTDLRWDCSFEHLDFKSPKLR